jgi:hypothetical protein
MQTSIGKISIQEIKLFKSLKIDIIKYSIIIQNVNKKFSSVFFE